MKNSGSNANNNNNSDSKRMKDANANVKPRPNVNAHGGSGTWDDKDYGYDTDIVHGHLVPDEKTGAILTPIVVSTTFVQESIDKYLATGYSYSRSGNPTVRALEEKVAVMERGYGSACFATGMAATVTVLSAFLKQGDHAVITNTSYGGTNRVCRIQFAPYGIEFSFVDFRDVSLVEQAIKPNTKLVFSESPANPTLTLTDVAAVSALCKRKGILHCCDTTFATPVIMRGIELGCDLVVQSLTKYYDGHNMTVGGAVISATKELDDRIHFVQNMHGNIMAPQTAFSILQASKTMHLRIQRQSETAMKVAQMLQKHPKVDVVQYPGLETFPQYELAKRQHLNGLHGGMLWFEVKGGTAAGRKLMDSVQRPWSLCENLGACESIITCPSVMTHANMLKEDRLKVGITDGFVRVSCGVEDSDDLIHALKSALDKL